MLIKTRVEIASSEITPKSEYEAYRMSRRQAMVGLGAMGAAAALPRWAMGEAKLPFVASKYNVTDRAITPEAKAMSSGRARAIRRQMPGR
jgi:hypothetical protein